MTDVKKFLFDTNDFGNEKVENAPLYSEDQLLMAREQGFAQGKVDGAKEAQQRQEERLIALLEKIQAMAEKLSAAEERREVEKHAEAAALALRVAQKILPQFAAEHALPEIERVIVQAIEARRDEPRVVVTVPAVHIDLLKQRMDALALEKSYAGKVILMADDSMPATDCRVEWADGGAERLYERLLAQISNEFSRAIASIGAALEQDEKQQP